MHSGTSGGKMGPRRRWDPKAGGKGVMRRWSDPEHCYPCSRDFTPISSGQLILTGALCGRSDNFPTL